MPTSRKPLGREYELYQRLRQVVPGPAVTSDGEGLPHVDDAHVALLRAAVPTVSATPDLVDNQRVAVMIGAREDWIRKLTIIRCDHLVEEAESRGMPVVAPARRHPNWYLTRKWKDWAAGHAPDGDVVDVPPYLLPVLFGWWTTGRMNVLDLPAPVGWVGLPPHAAPQYAEVAVEKWANWTGRLEADGFTPTPGAGLRISGYDRSPRTAA